MKDKPNVCTIPDVVLNYAGEYLSDFEKDEIKQFNNIYYIAGLVPNKIAASKYCNDNNFGYDDPDGNYMCISFDQIGYRYKLISAAGRGGFSRVYKVYDHEVGWYCAMKILKSKFSQLPLDANNEVNILKAINSKHVVQIYDHFKFRNHQCITLEYFPMTAYEFMLHQPLNRITLQIVQRLANSILLGLRDIKAQGIVHGDLKPENIGVVFDGNFKAKIFDFNMSFYEASPPDRIIQTYWFRAPEVILGGNYTTAVDMWSLACILYELHTGHVLFHGQGMDNSDQLFAMVEMLGIPSRRYLSQFPRHLVSQYFEISRRSGVRPLYCQVRRNAHGEKVMYGGVSSEVYRGAPGSRNLQIELNAVGHQRFLDFLRRCLVWEPANRMTVEEALEHPFITATVPLTTGRLLYNFLEFITRRANRDLEDCKMNKRLCTTEWNHSNHDEFELGNDVKLKRNTV